MKKYAFPLIFLFTLLVVQPVFAHPADFYFHKITIDLSTDQMLLTWELTPGPLLTQSMWLETDKNRDQMVTDDEALQEIQTILLPKIQVFLADKPLTFEIQNVEWPDYANFLTGTNPIRILLQAQWSEDLATTGQVIINNQFEEQASLTLFSIHADHGLVFQGVKQQGSTIQFVLTTQVSSETQTNWDSGQPTIPKAVEVLGLGEVAQQAVNQSPNQQGINAILEGLVRSNESSPSFIFAALAIAFIVGTLHALTPGHGKTVVAAYLVGSHGTLKHAIALGSTVTLTHTGSVFLLGIIALLASQYILPASLLPVLEIISGVLILALGFNLLTQRLRAWRRNAAPHSHDGLVPHHHDHDQDHSHTHVHEIPDPSDITWRSLLTLGISGGLVPCPEAIAILLLAININRILLGLSLILSFSLGLAVILITIGIVMVQSKNFFARLGFLDRWGTMVPIISALIVLGLGAVVTFGAAQNITGSLEQARDSKDASSANFDIQSASVVYVASDAKQNDQIFINANGRSKQLTRESQGIRDYSLSLDGTKLIYSAMEKKGGSSLWLLHPTSGKRERLLACPEALCWQGTWSRDTSRILYARLDFNQADNPLGFPSVWWLDLTNGQTGPVFSDAQLPVVNFSWSSDGVWLAYTSLVSYNIELRNLQTGQSVSVPVKMKGQVLWSPKSESFIYLDNISPGTEVFPHVFRYDINNAQVIALTEESAYNEYSPVWSPDGLWLAFIRQEFLDGIPALNDQIWLMRADGSEAGRLTQDVDALHGSPVWSPDGKYLLFASYLNTEAFSRIKILDIHTGQIREVAIGKSPAWLP